MEVSFPGGSSGNTSIATSDTVSKQQPEQPAEPSEYQQKLADQSAWRSFQRPVQLNVTGQQPRQSNVDAFVGRVELVASSSLKGSAEQPIVPGVADPHQWYDAGETTPTESLAIVKPLPPLPPLPKPEAVSFEVVGVEKPNEPQEKLDFDAIAAEPMPTVKSLLAELAPNSIVAKTPAEETQATSEPTFTFEQPTTVLAERPAPPRTLPQERFAQQWETGRY